MRIVVADCTVNYSGRLTAHLPRATRLIMVKSDGCVAIHADGGAYKPMNWMNAPNTIHEETEKWVVSNPKGETLIIDLHAIVHDEKYQFGDDPGLLKDGVEAHLQELLSRDPGQIEEGLVLVRREYPTDIGPVDLFCKDAANTSVAVEIKRRGEIDGVEQLSRYLEFLNKQSTIAPVRGIYVAQIIKPQAKKLAEHRGIAYVEVNYDDLRGIKGPQQKLF